jgi:hypothetical protein
MQAGEVLDAMAFITTSERGAGDAADRGCGIPPAVR